MTRAEISEHDDELDDVRWSDSDTLRRAIEQAFPEGAD